MTLECLVHAKSLGYKIVFTDHSLFTFGDTSSIQINLVLKMSLTEVDAAIAVSHCNKENLTLRARIDPSIIYVIPNALNNSNFYPMPEVRAKEPKERINIVFIGRLTFRKGIDLLVDLIPLMM